jgi:phosphoribosylformylglycinamidine synthase
MVPYEIMLSESQERMLMVLEDGREAEAFAVFAKWELDCAVIGRVTGTGRMVLRWHGQTVADVPVAPVSGASPVYDRPSEPAPKRLPLPANASEAVLPHHEALLRLVGSPDLASKRWIFEQYDHMVMGDTVQRPGGDAAVVRVHGTRRGLALATDCTPRYCLADPHLGGTQAVAESWRNLVATGAKPLAITNCLNFGNPERPGIMGQLVGCIEGMAAACRALDYPVVSGNVSLYNETDGQAILPTPNVGGVGLIEDLDRMVGTAWPEPGLTLVLLGECQGWLGCSLYAQSVLGRDDGAPPPVDLAAERRTGTFVLAEIAAGRVLACHDLADGGLAVAAAEMCLASGTGATLDVPADVATPAGWLFGEDQGRYLVTASNSDPLVRAMAAARVPHARVGSIGGDAIRIGKSGVSLRELRAAHEGFLPRLMGGEHPVA